MKTETKVYIIIPSIFIFIALILIVFLLFLLSGIKNSSNELLLQNGKLNFAKDQNRELEKFQNNYNDYQLNLDKIDKLFIDPQNPVNLINFLENIASESKVESNIALATLPPSKLKQVLPPFVSFSISCIGEFPNILKFSNKMETGPYLVEIKSINIKESKDIDAKTGKSWGPLRADFLINVFIKQNSI